MKQHKNHIFELHPNKWNLVQIFEVEAVEANKGKSRRRTKMILLLMVDDD